MGQGAAEAMLDSMSGKENLENRIFDLEVIKRASA